MFFEIFSNGAARPKEAYGVKKKFQMLILAIEKKVQLLEHTYVIALFFHILETCGTYVCSMYIVHYFKKVFCGSSQNQIVQLFCLQTNVSKFAALEFVRKKHTENFNW